MRRYLIIISILIYSSLIIIGSSFAYNKKSNPAIDQNQWHQITKGKLAAVYVEKVLYEFENSPFFLVKFRIVNLSAGKIGVDLRDYFNVFYPNQWSVNETKQRFLISERRIIPEIIDEKFQIQISSDFKNGNLTILPPHKEIFYYREFNAGGRKDIEEKDGNYFMLSLDGQLFFTDGDIVENINCSWEDESVKTDLVLPLPIIWKKILSPELIIKNSY